MPVTDWLTSAEAWANAHVRETHYLAALGLVLGVLFGGFLIHLAARFAVRMVRRLSDMITARAMRTDKTPGYRIVLARPVGRKRGGFDAPAARALGRRGRGTAGRLGA